MWESRWSRKAKCDEVGAEERSGPPYPGATVNEDGAILLFSDDADERLELSDGGRGKIGYGNVSEAHGGMLRLPGGREGRLGEGDDVSDAESGRDEGFEIVFGGRSAGGEKIGNDPALRAGALVRSSAGGVEEDARSWPEPLLHRPCRPSEREKGRKGRRRRREG